MDYDIDVSFSLASYAIKYGDLNNFKVFMTPQNVNFGTEWKLIHQVIRHGTIDFLNYCLEMGAEINALSCCGRTALCQAVMRTHDIDCTMNMVYVLLHAGANVHLGDPLRQSLRFCNFDISKLLIDRGAKADDISPKTLTLPIIQFIEKRGNCRRNAILLLGLHKLRILNIQSCKRQDVNILKLIGKHVWSFRMGMDFK